METAASEKPLAWRLTVKKTSKIPTKKLSLSKDTIRQLASDDLGHVAGMIDRTRDIPCIAPTTLPCQ
jgi:hypothetical protein